MSQDREPILPLGSILTGQDIAEAHLALTALLDRSLARAGSDRLEYVVLRLLLAGIDPEDQATAHRVLNLLTERATKISGLE